MNDNNLEINIELDDFTKFAEAIRQIPKQFDSIIIDELQKVAAKVESDARKLAPRDTGHLEDNIHMNDVSKEGSNYVVYIGTNVEYATYVHEMASAGGYETLSKSKVGGYAPGRKFLSNALTLSDENVEHAINNAIERVLGEV